MSRTTSTRQITSASTSALMAAQTVGRLINGLPGGRGRACGLSFWNQAWCCRAAPAPSMSSREIDGQSRPTREPSPSAGQSADIDGLSTTGICRAPLSSWRARTFHSPVAPSGPASAIASAEALISAASSGRASQTSLQREQRTVRPAVPTVARSMGEDVLRWGPTRGLMNLFCHDVALLAKDDIADLRKRIGIVLQDFRLLDHMTTYENVALPFRVIGREESSYRKEVIDLLKWVGLGERMDALPPILSGGEKQRAAFARAVISRPQLLLADEPTGNRDPTLGRRLLRLFIGLHKSGTAVVIATHDITLMDRYEARRLVPPQ